MVTKVVYENVAIGVIAQRIGECRFANGYVAKTMMGVTQQAGKAEQRYRDSFIHVNDKAP